MQHFFRTQPKFYNNKICIDASRSSLDERVVYGIFSYESNMTISSIVKCIDNYRQNNEVNLYPDFIVVLGKYYIVFDPSLKIYKGSVAYRFENDSEETEINICLASLMRNIKKKINNGNYANFDEYPIDYSQVELLYQERQD